MDIDEKFKGKTALVVDDEEDIREVLCMDLEDFGVTTFQASNGKEALEVVKQENIDFIISDVIMPHGSGVDLLEGLGKIDGSRRPIIVMISGFTDLSPEKAVEMGALKLFSKPFKSDDIYGLIASHLK